MENDVSRHTDYIHREMYTVSQSMYDVCWLVSVTTSDVNVLRHSVNNSSCLRRRLLFCRLSFLFVVCVFPSTPWGTSHLSIFSTWMPSSVFTLRWQHFANRSSLSCPSVGFKIVSNSQLLGRLAVLLLTSMTASHSKSGFCHKLDSSSEIIGISPATVWRTGLQGWAIHCIVARWREGISEGHGLASDLSHHTRTWLAQLSQFFEDALWGSSVQSGDGRWESARHGWGGGVGLCKACRWCSV